VVKSINRKQLNSGWITARLNKYNRNEAFIQVWYYEDLEENVKKVFSDEDADEVVSFLKQNGKTRVLKRVYCFINLLTNTLEIYRGPDSKTEEIISILEESLGVKFTQINLKSEELQAIYSQHATELKQAMFRNVEGLFYEILRGNRLENNEKFKGYMNVFPDCLRVISFRPKIKFLNHANKYQVTLNGDKGTIKLSSNGFFHYRPRFEVRQLVFLIAATIGLLK
jgi:hypothetical protein